MSELLKDWQVKRDPSHYDTLSTVMNSRVRIEIGGELSAKEQAEIAYLIAAAPDMLKVLELIDKLSKAAIAKAKGEQP